MHVEIVQRQPMLVAGLARPFIQGMSKETNAPQVIGPLWDDFFRLHKTIPQRMGDEMYGVMYDPPPGSRTHPEELIYLAGVQVSSAEGLPAGITTRQVPGGAFARIVHRGPITGIMETVEFIYRDWLPGSGFAHTDECDLEIYGPKFHHEREDSEMEYLISVRPLS